MRSKSGLDLTKLPSAPVKGDRIVIQDWLFTQGDMTATADVPTVALIVCDEVKEGEICSESTPTVKDVSLESW